MILRAGSDTKVVVTKSSLQHSVGKTRFSTWELVEDSKMDRHTPASVILVILINSLTGDITSPHIREQFYLIFVLLPPRQTWGNRFCHDASDIQDFNQCELYPANPDMNGSPLRCCNSNNRSSCQPSFIQALLVGGQPPSCARTQYWSERLQYCVQLWG